MPLVFLKYVDFLLKILLFRTQHLCNFTTELILRVYIPLIFNFRLFHGKLPSIWKPNSHFIWCQHPLGNWFLKQSQNIQLPLHSWYWSQPLWKNQLWSYGPRYRNMLKSKSLNFLNWIWFCYTHFYMKIQILSEKITENLGFETPLH